MVVYHGARGASAGHPAPACFGAVGGAPRLRWPGSVGRRLGIGGILRPPTKVRLHLRRRVDGGQSQGRSRRAGVGDNPTDWRAPLPPMARDRQLRGAGSGSCRAPSSFATAAVGSRPSPGRRCGRYPNGSRTRRGDDRGALVRKALQREGHGLVPGGIEREISVHMAPEIARRLDDAPARASCGPAPNAAERLYLVDVLYAATGFRARFRGLAPSARRPSSLIRRLRVVSPRCYTPLSPSTYRSDNASWSSVTTSSRSRWAVSNRSALSMLDTS